MAITIALRMFRLYPIHEKSGGCFPRIASHDIDRPDEPPGIIWIWSSRQVCQAQSTAASRAAACTFVMASWGGALGLDPPSTRDGWSPGSSWQLGGVPGSKPPSKWLIRQDVGGSRNPWQ
jgi:hypothetical protein